jgi:hypothetical protein
MSNRTGTTARAIAAMSHRTLLFAAPAGGGIQVTRVGGGFRVQIGGKLTGAARTYATAAEAAIVVDRGSHAGAAR